MFQLLCSNSEIGNSWFPSRVATNCSTRRGQCLLAPGLELLEHFENHYFGVDFISLSFFKTKFKECVIFSLEVEVDTWGWGCLTLSLDKLSLNISKNDI